MNALLSPATSAEWACAFEAARLFIEERRAAHGVFTEPVEAQLSDLKFLNLSKRAQALVRLSQVIEQPIESLDVTVKGQRS